MTQTGDTGDYQGSAGCSWCAITDIWDAISSHSWLVTPLSSQDRSPHESDISSMWPHTTGHTDRSRALSHCLIPAFIQPLHCSVLSAVIILDIIHYPASNNTQTGQIFTGRVSVMALISDASHTPLSGFMGTIAASLNCWWQKVTLHSW